MARSDDDHVRFESRADRGAVPGPVGGFGSFPVEPEDALGGVGGARGDAPPLVGIIGFPVAIADAILSMGPMIGAYEAKFASSSVYPPRASTACQSETALR